MYVLTEDMTHSFCYKLKVEFLHNLAHFNTLRGLVVTALLGLVLSVDYGG